MKEYKKTVLANARFRQIRERALALLAKHACTPIDVREHYNRDDKKEGLEIELAGPVGEKLTLFIFVQLDWEENRAFARPDDALLFPSQHHFVGKIQSEATRFGKLVKITDQVAMLLRDFQFSFELNPAGMQSHNGMFYADLEKGYRRGWGKYSPLCFRFGLLARQLPTQQQQPEA